MAAPANAASPTISGTAQQGHTLTAQSGSWNGTNPILFAYQWRRCNSSGASCTDIAGATHQTYTATSADVGATLRVAILATNTDGTASATSDPSAAVSSVSAPVNEALPTISGTAQQDKTLTAGNGTWTGSSLTFSYEWRRCDANGGSCATIAGATGQTYTLVAADVDHTLRVSVSATTASGAATVLSASSAVVANLGGAPASTLAPVITGKLLQGSTVMVSQGSWSGATPISYAYGWQRCDTTGDQCITIPGAISPSYTLVKADLGNSIRGVVTASNSVGSTTGYSTLSTVVESLAPVNTALPMISGTDAVGDTLTANNGSWTGTAPLQYFPQWARSNAGGGFDPIPGATRSSYKLTAADAGHKLFVQVKAQNSNGVAWANSSPTAAIAKTAAAATVEGLVSVSSISLPNRLTISGVSFAPSVLRSRTPVQARFQVTDSQGHPVQGALVYALALPYGWSKTAKEQATGADGWATITLTPTAALPLAQHQSLVVFVRARKPGGDLLAGVSTRRLVQVRIG